MGSSQWTSVFIDYGHHLIKSIDDSGKTSLVHGKEELLKLYTILVFKAFGYSYLQLLLQTKT